MGPAVHMQCVDCTSRTVTLSSSWNKRMQRLALASQAIACSKAHLRPGHISGRPGALGRAHTKTSTGGAGTLKATLQLSLRPRMAG